MERVCLRKEETWPRCPTSHRPATRNPTPPVTAGSFDAFVGPHLPVLLRVAGSLCRNSMTPRIWSRTPSSVPSRASDGFDGAYPRAWLLTIMRNANINRHRRRRPGLLHDATDLAGEADRRNQPAPSAEDVAATHAAGTMDRRCARTPLATPSPGGPTRRRRRPHLRRSGRRARHPRRHRDEPPPPSPPPHAGPPRTPSRLPERTPMNPHDHARHVPTQRRRPRASRSADRSRPTSTADSTRRPPPRWPVTSTPAAAAGSPPTTTDASRRPSPKPPPRRPPNRCNDCKPSPRTSPPGDTRRA